MCLEIDFVREEVDRVGAGRSFLLLELAEFDLAFPPLAEEDVSDLFERRDRLSTGMFCERSLGYGAGWSSSLGSRIPQ